MCLSCGSVCFWPLPPEIPGWFAVDFMLILDAACVPLARSAPSTTRSRECQRPVLACTLRLVFSSFPPSRLAPVMLKWACSRDLAVRFSVPECTRVHKHVGDVVSSVTSAPAAVVEVMGRGRAVWV